MVCVVEEVEDGAVDRPVGHTGWEKSVPLRVAPVRHAWTEGGVHFLDEFIVESHWRLGENRAEVFFDVARAAESEVPHGLVSRVFLTGGERTSECCE